MTLLECMVDDGGRSEALRCVGSSPTDIQVELKSRNLMGQQTVCHTRVYL